MRKLFPILLLAMLGRASAQINIPNINTFASSPSQPNCTGIHQSQPDPGWEDNCDEGTPNCSAANGHICASTPVGLITTPSLDSKAREMDLNWTCLNGANSCGTTYGGVIFHAGINTGGDIADASFTWGGKFYYTDLGGPGKTFTINQLEFDLNQVMTNSDVMIYASQCDFTNGGGHWEFSNGWGLSSNISCPISQWTLNTWHSVFISAHRCSNFVSGQPCLITYDSVSFDGVVTNCTNNCVADGRDSLSWGPVGLLLENVQMNPSFMAPGGTKFYADLMMTVAPESTTQQGQQLKCDTITGPRTLVGNVITITNPMGTNCSLK